MKPWAVALLASALCAAFPAAANQPAMFQNFRGCVAEGFLLLGDGSDRRLVFDDNPNWSVFDGKVVAFRRLWGSRVNRLMAPPTVVGPCDPAAYALLKARVSALRSISDLIRRGRPEEGLDAVERAVATAPDDCLLLAARVFALEHTGHQREADAAGARAAALNCAPQTYGRRLQQLRTNREPWSQ